MRSQTWAVLLLPPAAISRRPTRRPPPTCSTGEGSGAGGAGGHAQVSAGSTSGPRQPAVMRACNARCCAGNPGGARARGPAGCCRWQAIGRLAGLLAAAAAAAAAVDSSSYAPRASRASGVSVQCAGAAAASVAVLECRQSAPFCSHLALRAAVSRRRRPRRQSRMRRDPAALSLTSTHQQLFPLSGNLHS